MGTTQSTTTLPASGVASSARVSACPAYGTATITRSAAPATSTFDPPRTDTSTPPAAAPARVATSEATCSARSASRDPSSTRYPAAASRTASPRPCGPVPPSTPTTRSSTARPSVTGSPVPVRAPAGRACSRRSCLGRCGRADPTGPAGSAVALLPGAVRGVGRLVPLGDLVQGVLGLGARRERAVRAGGARRKGPEPVPLGAAVARLDRVVLQAEEEGSLVHRRSPLEHAGRPALSLAPSGRVPLLQALSPPPGRVPEMCRAQRGSAARAGGASCFPCPVN